MIEDQVRERGLPLSVLKKEEKMNKEKNRNKMKLHPQKYMSLFAKKLVISLNGNGV